jgi:hypothetical protein
VIVWLNGTFGCGKSTTVAELRSLVPSSRLFDPETVGYMVRPNLPDHPVSDFPALAAVAAAGGSYRHGWRLAHLADYRTSRSWMSPAADLVVDTECRTPSAPAHLIADALPGL